jgi:alpha-2-macroglobulin-like protein
MEGNCLIKFKLPTSMEVGDGTLSCVIEDGGVLETASKTIPILLQSLDVRVYPEGGDFINGHECGVYIEAFTPYGDPADLVGDIVNDSGKIVGNISTKHEGRGKSSFTPKKGEKYSLKITKPSGITKSIPFPLAKDVGVSLMTTQDVYDSNKIIVSVSAPKGNYVAHFLKRDINLDTQKISIENNEKILLTFNGSNLEGVLRVLITDSSGNPLAERLVFHKGPSTIDVKITSDYKSYSPGDKATIKVQTNLSDGKNVSAILGVTVTDESVLKSIEERKSAPRLKQMVFLESEVEHFEDSNIYLSDHPNAELAVDLLLGTQGWRRFAFMKLNEFIKLKGVMGERISAFHEGGDLKSLYDDKFARKKEENERREFKKKNVDRMMMPMRAMAMNAPMQKMELLEKEAPVKKQMMEKIAIVPKKLMEEKIVMAPKIQDIVVASKFGKPQMKIAMRKDVNMGMKMKKEKKMLDEDLFGLPQVAKNPSLTTRIFAFKKNPNRQAGERTKFVETLYWASDLKTNEEGETSFSFDLSDSVTSYRIMIGLLIKN